MKINDNRKQAMQSFNSIHSIGEIFDYAGEIYMIIQLVEDEFGQCYNTVCLNDGELVYFNDDDQVQVLNEVTLEIH